MIFLCICILSKDGITWPTIRFDFLRLVFPIFGEKLLFTGTLSEEVSGAFWWGFHQRSLFIRGFLQLDWETHTLKWHLCHGNILAYLWKTKRPVCWCEAPRPPNYFVHILKSYIYWVESLYIHISSPKRHSQKQIFFPPSPWSILLVLMYLNLNPDLNTYNRVNKQSSSNLEVIFFFSQVLATTSKKQASQSQSVFIYLSPFLCCYLWYLWCCFLVTCTYPPGKCFVFECMNVGVSDGVVAWISNKIKSEEDSFVSLLCVICLNPQTDNE